MASKISFQFHYDSFSCFLFKDIHLLYNYYFKFLLNRNDSFLEIFQEFEDSRKKNKLRKMLDISCSDHDLFTQLESKQNDRFSLTDLF